MLRYSEERKVSVLKKLLPLRIPAHREHLFRPNVNTDSGFNVNTFADFPESVFIFAGIHTWTAYKETCRHLTGAEVRGWLNTWGTNEESVVPECHD